jgi:uroporphyrinogen decarboxylase
VNALARLHAAMEGTPADRIPVFCNLLDQGARLLGIGPREYYASGEHVAEAQLRMREKYGYDNLWGLFYVGREAEFFGCREMVYAEDGPPSVGHMVIRTVEDVPRLEPPADVLSHPAFEQPRKCFDILRREAGGRFPICAYVTATMTLPVLLMGMERWLPLLLTGPRTLRDELLAKCHDFFVSQVRACRAAGADVIVYSNPFGSTDLVPMSFFREQSLPWIERDIEAAGRAGLVYYGGAARVNPVIETVLERTRVEAFYLSPLDDVAEGRARIAGRALCCAALNDIPMIDWAPAQVEQEVKRLVEAGKPGGRFLFGTLLMPLAIPEVNIRALVAAACRYGALDA